MTTIISTTGNNYACVVADRGITSDLIHHDLEKVVQQGSWLIAGSGSSRACDVLQFGVKFPKPPVSLQSKSDNEWRGWVVSSVVPVIQKAFKDGQVEADDFEAILITHGRSYHLDSTLGVLSAYPYWAIGSGAQLAIGYLSDAQYSENWYKNNDLVAKYAAQIASMHDPNTRGTLDLWISDHSGKAYKA
jgi:20S proteasome alpha/beta subunit